MNRFLSLVLIISVITGCERNPEFQFNEKAKRDFAILPGKIGFTIETPPDRLQYIIEKAALVKVASLPNSSKEATAIELGYGGASGLPAQKGYDYRGPYLASPDKRYVAASISTGPSANPSDFVIVDTRANKTIAFVGGDETRRITGLAWSPDSKWIAVLKRSSRLGWGPFDILGTLLGHPTPYMTFYLEVVNTAGDVVARSKLIWETSGSSGSVVWLE